MLALLWGNMCAGEGFGQVDRLATGNTVIGAIAQAPESSALAESSSFEGVGRTWAFDPVTGTFHYFAYLSSYHSASGIEYSALDRSRTGFARQLVDFGGVGLDNMCNALVWAHDGLIAACRYMSASGYYDIALLKINRAGQRDPGFGTNGIVLTGIGGDSTKGHAFVQGIAFDKDDNTSSHGLVAVVGGIGSYSTGKFVPYIATFDQKRGSQLGVTLSKTGIAGTASGVAYDSGTNRMYMIYTETAGANSWWLDRYHATASGPKRDCGEGLWCGKVIDGHGAFGAGTPSAITGDGANVYISGSVKAGRSVSLCAVAAVKLAARGISAPAHWGVTPALGGLHQRRGVTVFSHEATGKISHDCTLNAIAESVSPVRSPYYRIGVGGEAFVASSGNHDYLTAQLNSADGSLLTRPSTKTRGSSDDRISSVLFLPGDKDYLIAAGTTVFDSVNQWKTIGVERVDRSGKYTEREKEMWEGMSASAPEAWPLSGSHEGLEYDPIADSWSPVLIPAGGKVFLLALRWTGTDFTR